MTPEQMNFTLQLASILFGGGGIIAALFTWYSKRGESNANLAQIYEKLASFDPAEMLALKERVQNLEKPRDFVFTTRVRVDGDGIQVTGMEAKEVKTMPLRAAKVAK